MKQVILTVPDIFREHCERAITEALTAVEGVECVVVDILRKQVKVAYDEGRVDLGLVTGILQDEDYRVQSVNYA